MWVTLGVLKFDIFKLSDHIFLTNLLSPKTVNEIYVLFGGLVSFQLTIDLQICMAR